MNRIEWWRGARRPRQTLAAALLSALALAGCSHAPRTQFSVSFPASVHSGPITGRVYVMLSRDSSPEPRLRAGSFVVSVPFFGADVSAMQPGQQEVIDGSTLGYPVSSLRDVPAGDYYVQALLNVYTEFHRADGHVIWAHMDQWEGQQFNRSPGNLYSSVVKVHLDPAQGFGVALSLTHVIPPVRMPADTKWVKHIKIQDKRLTEFWGHPMYLGATVLLPEGYDTHPKVRYPVVYQQGHFNLRPPYGFSPDSVAVPAIERERLESLDRQTGYQFYKSWVSPHFPRMIVVEFQHPTPYFDDSYAVNSANDGPYGDALIEDLVPYLESHFRMIAQPWARALTGTSTGGWESLALQVFHPRFFDGTWTDAPDPVDFRHDQLFNAYADTNAFVLVQSRGTAKTFPTPWQRPERYMMRTVEGQPFRTQRAMSQLEEVLGSHGRSGQQFDAWDAVYGPVGKDGYPVPLWNMRTGHIDHAVAEYYKEHGYDLRAYLAQHWDSIGRDLVDKIHVDVGDMDNFYLNLAVYDLQAYLDSTKDPAAHATFNYGRPEKGHGWRHTDTANMMREIAAFITRHAPRGADTRSWKY